MMILEKECSTIGEQPSNRLIQPLMQQRLETNSLARVLLLGEAQVNDWFYSPQGSVLGSGNSTEDGTFRVVVDQKSQAPFRKFLVVCIADGFAMRSQELAYSFDLHDISIELARKTRSIEGVIEGEDVKPIAGAAMTTKIKSSMVTCESTFKAPKLIGRHQCDVADC